MTFARSEAINANLIVVDDDDLFRESIVENLKEAGFRVEAFRDGREALSYFMTDEKPDLLLLDWKMPIMNGIEVLRRMRLSQIEVPTIFLTVLGDQIYEEAALLGGAVDFIEKSRSFSILLRRIDLILSRAAGETPLEAHGADPPIIEAGPMLLRFESNRAYWKESQVDLSLSEFRLVRILVENAGQDISYRTLYDLIHGEGFFAGEGDIGFRANVRAFIKRIRQKFREVDREFDKIENYPGFGYRWTADDAS
jgi:two-component system response regulator ChvI